MTAWTRQAGWDLVIRGASVYDGRGGAPLAADVAIRGDRIAAVGQLDGGGEVLEAPGLALAPGFIDAHSHDDVAVLLTPRMDFKLMQGVTTDVVGNCGAGAAPYAVASRMFRIFHGEAELPQWDGFGGYMSLLDREPPSLNVAVLVGHNALRYGASGGEARAPSAVEMGRMRDWLQEGLNAGAVGLSTGLIYEPGRHARTEEIATLAGDVASAGGVYATHMRNEASGLLDSIRETLHIGEVSGAAVQVSHHKVTGRENWGKVSDSLKLLDEARAAGLDVTADQYPYTSGSTTLHAVVHNNALGARGEEGALGRIRAADVIFASVPRRPEWEGRTLAEISCLLALPAKAAAHRALKLEPGAVVIVEVAAESDVRTVLRHPTTMIGTDGIPAAGSNPHPRLYGTFARVLGRYVREQGVLPLEEAIRRMTSFPAEKFRLADRGVIRVGAYADLVLFDPATIAEAGTLTDPRHHPHGIEHVFVNGVQVVDGGEHTGARPGRALRRGC
jgi:N-acyl-D-amino-acid deacylase